MLSAPLVEVSAAARTTWKIGIKLSSCVRLTVDSTVDAEALSCVISMPAR